MALSLTISTLDTLVNAISSLVIVEGKKFFQDHQEYTETVIQELSEQIRESSISYVVTTEKDMVKLPESFLFEFEVYVIKIEVVFKNELIIRDIILPLLLN